MLQTIKYSFLRLLRNKSEVFWILCFPILLGICFKVGFANIQNSETFSAIPVAIVSENQENYSVFKQTADTLGEGSDNQMLDITYTSKNDAEKLLKDKKIDGILTVSDKVKLTVSANASNISVNQSILNSFVKQYNVSKDAFMDIAMNHPDKLQNAIKNMTSEVTYSNKVLLTDRENSDNFTQYFYNLLAMACLFTSMSGMYIAIQNQGNLSFLGARRCISPMHKLKSIIGELISHVGFNFTCNLIAYIFLVAVLKVDLTAHLPLEILTLFMSTLTGISFGFFIGSFGTASDHVKNGIVLSVVMTSCFLSGLMVGGMKQIIEDICPLLNRINPAVIISDSFYSLSVYDTFERYSRDIISLIIMITIFTIGGFLLTRRKKYASL